MNPLGVVHHSEERHILYIARVSSNQENTDTGLIRWLIEQNHWSPFEMVSACIEIDTTRDIGRQILRHKSCRFQEFSQRYKAVDGTTLPQREMRRKGSSNRQGSLDARDPYWEARALAHAVAGQDLYEEMLADDIAPECARSVLSEGYAPTRMYVHGDLRSWIHYIRERMRLNTRENRPWAQREHYRIANHALDRLAPLYPATFSALREMAYIDQPVAEAL